MNGKVIVLLSVYCNDKPTWLAQCLESLLNQTYQNFHILLSVDGEISIQLDRVLNEYERSSKKITVFKNLECKGLAYRLNELINHALENISSFSYFARMDADDISDLNRFKIQVEYLNENPNIDIIGTDIIEYSDESKCKRIKRMPKTHDELINNIVKRCPLNHPTVMLRRDVFVNPDNRYDEKLKNTQDYKLWILLISKGFKLENINIPLLTFRISQNFYKKRGIIKLRNDLSSRIYAMQLLHLHSIKNYTYLALIFLFRMSPKFLVKLAYKLR